MLMPAVASLAQISPSAPGWSAMSTARQSSIEAKSPSFCSASRPLAGSSAMIFALPSNTARALMFTLALPRAWATWARVPGLLASCTVSCLARGMASPPLRCLLSGLAGSEDLPAEPEERIVEPIDDPLLQRDDAVVGDTDPLRADLGAAAGDVAQARTELVSDRRDPVGGIERVHLQRGEPDQEARADEGLLAPVIAQHVADVLAQEALDAFAELLHPVDVPLHHPILSVGIARPRSKRRDPPVLLVVPGDVGHQVLDDREGLDRLHRDRLFGAEQVHAGHAGEARPAVDLRAARAASPRLAVPADREIVGQPRLDAVDHVQDHHPRIDLDLVLDEAAAASVAPPDPERPLRHGPPRAPRSSRRPSPPAPRAARDVRRCASPSPPRPCGPPR